MLLEVERLRVELHTRRGSVTAVEDFSLALEPGEAVGLVGESGSGKTVTAHALMGLLPRERAAVTGRAMFDGSDLFAMSRAQLRQMQGRQLSIVFQEPMTSLNPTMRIGRQVEDALRVHTGLDAGARRQRALEAMALAGLPEPEGLYRCYPHQLSGGMRQRVMIAAALVLRPQLLIADEPTTALDVTIQAQILDTLRQINRQEGTAILLISHDLGVVRALCSRVVVMRQGVIVEQGRVEDIFHRPQQAYTRQLLEARPSWGKGKGGQGHG